MAKRIVCIIPTLNECDTIGHVVSQAKRQTDHVVVVDGHSSDETCIHARSAGAEVLYQIGQGKGMALQTAFHRVHEDIYVIIDGDATYDANEIQKILQPIKSGRADMVIGTRLNGRMEEGAMSAVNMFGNRLFNFLINIFYNGSVTDSQSGLRALNRQTIDLLQLSSPGFEVETEMTVKALKLGLNICEVPITYVKRRGTPSKLNSMVAGVRILKTILIPE